jgi:ubiquinone/menaquinone biosynthesis C-methylase UbiE
MADVWTTYNDLDTTTQKRLAQVLELRGAMPEQRRMRKCLLEQLIVPPEARVLDVGCGTGIMTRLLADLPSVGHVTGIDPGRYLLETARSSTRARLRVEFREGSAEDLPFPGGSFDLVVMDSVLSHLREPVLALVEAARVLGPGGQLAIFDGDYATATVSLGERDPLQACIDTALEYSVANRYVVRHLPRLIHEAKLELASFQSHGYAEVGQGGYIMSLIDRGADILGTAGQLDTASAQRIKLEASKRSEQGRFFGYIAYASLVARRS